MGRAGQPHRRRPGAAHPGAAGRGTLVVVGEEIHAARRVRKVHTQRLDAFRSELGPVGRPRPRRVRFHEAPSAGPSSARAAS